MPDAAWRAIRGPAQSLSGRWMNEDGSVLDLEVHVDGRVTGSFRCSRDGTQYRPYRVTGTYSVRAEGGRGVVGSVQGWPSHSSVTVWCAEYDGFGDVLETRWLLAVDPATVGDGVSPVGGNVFRRSGGGSAAASA